MLRALLLANGLALLAVLVRNREWAALPLELVLMAAQVELPLFLALTVLLAVQPVLRRLQARLAQAAVLAVALGATALAHALAGPDAGDLLRWLLCAALATAATLAYLQLRDWTHTPALAEARLMALTARIRPHFLFNSLNGVLGVIRSDPRRAELALEELADLFRALMQDNRELVPLDDELSLCERYLELERLRLGERLQVRWQLQGCPRDALVPPLMLQPLIENAVYHGIEPTPGPGEVTIGIALRGSELSIEIANPEQDVQAHLAGNRMAVDNIRERLALFFDLEAQLDTGLRDGRYVVRIRLPYRRAT
ncbi:MAG: histidine kinase [Zoogloea sp.]|nr:histidine kinase [Zoogloea sp.]